jgi:hypothetical protein
VAGILPKFLPRDVDALPCTSYYELLGHKGDGYSVVCRLFLALDIVEIRRRSGRNDVINSSKPLFAFMPSEAKDGF